MEINNRFGTFSSSSIWKLMTKDRTGTGNGAPAKKYIKQVQYELNLGRPLNKEVDSIEILWGKMNELRVFQKLSMEYSLISKNRLFHPEIKYWSGAPDLINKNEMVVGDIKCPYSIEMFCDKLKALANIKTYKEEFPEDYWQHISNSILLEKNGCEIKYFEAIIYMPYLSEIEEIKQYAVSDEIEYSNFKNEYTRFYYAKVEELPYLLDGGHYRNINIIRWEINPADKNLLTEKIIKAGELLLK